VAAHPENQSRGRVASLHMHPPVAGEPMLPADSIAVETDAGIVGNTRYWKRQSRSTDQPTQRQVTLIEREQIEEHASALGLPGIAAGRVRSNIETEGINLVPLAGRDIRVGGAVLHIAAPRDPCHKMDEIAPGLRERMTNDKQGVLAVVVQSGTIKNGDAIQPIN